MSTSMARLNAEFGIDKQALALNSRRDMKIDHVDWAGTPILVIDQLYCRPDYVRALALSLDFYRSAGLYPGLFAFVSLSQPELLNLINECMAPLSGRELIIHPYYQDMSFAMMTKRAGELVPAQCIPHYDNFCDVAGVVYLNPEEQCAGGTSFWRHRATMMTAAPRSGDVDAAAMAPLFGVKDEAELLRFCLEEGLAGAPSGFPCESTAVWELGKVIPMKYNRLILYNARLFHSPHIVADTFGEGSETRRLTQNLYFNWSPTSAQSGR